MKSHSVIALEQALAKHPHQSVVLILTSAMESECKTSNSTYLFVDDRVSLVPLRNLSVGHVYLGQVS